MLDAVLNAFAEITAAPSSLTGSLEGLPYAAKDIFRTPSRQPGCGLAPGWHPDIIGTSDLLNQLAAHGADLVGFTNLSELAYEPSGWNSTSGRVSNPWNFDFISGGSSSGSAAAVASGCVFVALGSDTAGSLRIPAHACGVTAWKPTHALVSTTGMLALAQTLDSVGLLARGAEDMMPLVAVIARSDHSRGIESAALIVDAVAECDPDVRRASEAMTEVLTECDLTIERRHGLAAIEAIDGHALIVLQGESARAHRSLLDHTGLSAALRRRLMKGLDIPDSVLAASIRARARLVHEFEEQVLCGNDVAMLPIMPIITPRATDCDPESTAFSPRTLYALSRFTRFVNMLGLPAVALPSGFDSRGMPVGMQIVGRAGSDFALLELVRSIQSRTDWHGRVPDAVKHLVEDDGGVKRVASPTSN